MPSPYSAPLATQGHDHEHDGVEDDGVPPSARRYFPVCELGLLMLSILDTVPCDQTFSISRAQFLTIITQSSVFLAAFQEKVGRFA